MAKPLDPDIRNKAIKKFINGVWALLSNHKGIDITDIIFSRHSGGERTLIKSQYISANID